MKLFTLLITAFFLVSLPSFSGGRSDDSMRKSDDVKMESGSAMEKDMSGPFTDFTNLDSAGMMAESKPTVLFFHAGWCPSCKAAIKDFEENSRDWENINLIIVDYDNSAELQKKYSVTYQHTFVQISADADVLAKWNGGGTSELLKMIVKKEM